MYKNHFNKLSAFVLIINVLIANFSISAQTTRTSSAAKTTKTSAPKCSGAWTGVIRYTRTQSMSDNKIVERVSGRGQDTRDWQMKYDYKASVSVVEAPEKNGSSVGKATITHNFSSVEKISAVEKNSCDQGKTWRDMRGESTSRTETSGNGRADANVTVGVNSDGTYTVSVGLPQINGEMKGSTTSSFSGQCTAKEGKTLTQPPTPMPIEGNSLTSDGKDQINPSDPNRISGSFTQTMVGITETITWNLQKCGAPLRIMDLKFEDMKFPNWNDWQEINEIKGTTDGNLIKIKAKVLNASGETKYADIKFKETYKGDKWDGAKPDGLLENGEVSVRLEAGEEKDVEMIWDSSGYSWFDDGRPRLVQRLKAELEENGKKTDEITRNLKVAPKPVILAHGIWSSYQIFELWQNMMTTMHSYDWKAYAVGEKSGKGLMQMGGSFMSGAYTNNIYDNSVQFGKYVKYAQEERNAWHVDIVGHSLGGVVARHYIHNFMPTYEDGRPQAAHLLMLGTPNTGSPCFDLMAFAMEMTGKAPEATKQMTQDAMTEFNKLNTNRKGVKFSALAGNSDSILCKAIVPNDDVVSVPSATWRVRDKVIVDNSSEDLPNTKNFNDFVKPRLAIGPKGNHNPVAPDLDDFPKQVGQTNQNNFGAYFTNAAYRSELSAVANGSDLRPDFAKAVKIAPKQSVEIEIPIAQANNFGLTFMALPEISATLYNDKGEIVGKNLTKTPNANAWFRSIYVDKNVAGGTWKLKLENTFDKELEAIIATWNNASGK